MCSIRRLHQRVPFQDWDCLSQKRGPSWDPLSGKVVHVPKVGSLLQPIFGTIYHAQVVSIVEPLFDKCHVCPRGQVHPGTPVHLGTPFQNKRHACGTSIMLVPKAGCTLEPLFGRSVMLVPKSVVHRGILFGTNIMFVPKAG